MKIWFAFIAIFILTVSCHRSPKSIAVKSTSLSRSDSINKEYFDWNKVKLNGTIPMISSYKAVVKQLGKPDKVDALMTGVNGSYYNKKFQYCYFKGATFEKYNDTLVFSELDFSKPTSFYLTDGIIRFDGSTKDIDFKTQFPFSFENNQLSGTSMDVYEYISLSTAPKKTSDELDFTFHVKDGKIWSIDHDDPQILK